VAAILFEIVFCELQLLRIGFIEFLRNAATYLYETHRSKTMIPDKTKRQWRVGLISGERIDWGIFGKYLRVTKKPL
jgi:hypothetical protein